MTVVTEPDLDTLHGLDWHPPCMRHYYPQAPGQSWCLSAGAPAVWLVVRTRQICRCPLVTARLFCDPCWQDPALDEEHVWLCHACRTVVNTVPDTLRRLRGLVATPYDSRLL